ncbi:hypothetical protein EGR_07902 [Echinococcus granulosus]|uniref:Uncharacterized protein n=1 Tax=Echinococcus granulosus TaxID=6210 RepID=W6U7R8_ECHGR|nr:hypothetical protein EGR_07902 [Echinococcus granulosus]EUB57225.1 hypothetical protein EGR_07902 [Echinococcus granulosus]
MLCGFRLLTIISAGILHDNIYLLIKNIEMSEFIYVNGAKNLHVHSFPVVLKCLPGKNIRPSRLPNEYKLPCDKKIITRASEAINREEDGSSKAKFPVKLITEWILIPVDSYLFVIPDSPKSYICSHYLFPRLQMCELPGGKGVWLRKKYIPASLMFLHTFAYIFSVDVNQKKLTFSNMKAERNDCENFISSDYVHVLPLLAYVNYREMCMLITPMVQEN